MSRSYQHVVLLHYLLTAAFFIHVLLVNALQSNILLGKLLDCKINFPKSSLTKNLSNLVEFRCSGRWWIISLETEFYFMLQFLKVFTSWSQIRVCRQGLEGDGIERQNRLLWQFLDYLNRLSNFLVFFAFLLNLLFLFGVGERLQLDLKERVIFLLGCWLPRLLLEVADFAVTLALDRLLVESHSLHIFSFRSSDQHTLVVAFAKLVSLNLGLTVRYCSPVRTLLHLLGAQLYHGCFARSELLAWSVYEGLRCFLLLKYLLLKKLRTRNLCHWQLVVLLHQRLKSWNWILWWLFSLQTSFWKIWCLWSCHFSYFIMNSSLSFSILFSNSLSFGCL